MDYDSLDSLLHALPELAAQHRAEMADIRALFLVETRQGRKVYLRLAEGCLTLPEHPADAPDCTIYAGEGDLLDMMAGKLSPAKALLFGKVKVKGDPKPLMDLIGLLK